MVYIKDPDAVLDYLFDWQAWLGDGTIVNFSVASATGLTVDSSVTINADTAVQVWLSGGQVGVSYDVTCRVETSDGRVDDRTMRIIVQER